MHRKAEVKKIITDVINSMTDEEEEGEEAEENAEAGDDGDKDEDAQLYWTRPEKILWRLHNI